VKKIRDAALEIVHENPLLHFGMYHGLLNLSQVARFIRPMIEARTRKDVRDTAVLMSLSRLRGSLSRAVEPGDLILDNINIHSGLCSLTVLKTRSMHEELNALFAKVMRRGGFITITDGMSEITAILEDEDFELAESMISQKLQYVYRDLASVGVRFSRDTIARAGVIYQLIQQVAVQNINIVEVASTASEFNIYVRSEDIRLAFDSIYQRFSKRAGGASDI